MTVWKFIKTWKVELEAAPIRPGEKFHDQTFPPPGDDRKQCTICHTDARFFCYGCAQSRLFIPLCSSNVRPSCLKKVHELRNKIWFQIVKTFSTFKINFHTVTWNKLALSTVYLNFYQWSVFFFKIQIFSQTGPFFQKPINQILKSHLSVFFFAFRPYFQRKFSNQKQNLLKMFKN